MAARRIVFVWENLGPSHFDRLKACAADPLIAVTGIELFGASIVYDWDRAGGEGLKRITLYPDGSAVRRAGLWWRLWRAIRRERPDAVFLCHYSFPPVFLVALVLRLTGVPVFTMIDSKFDDMERAVWREVGKVLLLAPYNGALAGSRRTANYLRFLGFRQRKIVEGFDTIDVARFALQAATVPDVGHAARDFLVVARLVKKKNLEFAIRAFAEWCGNAVIPRKLRIVGYGKLGAELAKLADSLGVANNVVFAGKADSRQVAEAMRTALCLILPSLEEQFGLVVIEALALGLPVLVSGNAGAVDGMIDNGVNGWVVDPLRPDALVAAMALLDRDEAIWRAASEAALASAERGDVRHFAAGVKALT